MVSAWSAKCTRRGDPMSYHNAPECPGTPPDLVIVMPCGRGTVRGHNAPQRPGNPLGASGVTRPPIYAWTDITYLLHAHHVSWAYYVAQGTQPDCWNDAMTCDPSRQSAGTPGIWNPLPYFDTVHHDQQLGNIQDIAHFYAAAKSGTLPAIAWIVPNQADSEHPPALVRAGQTYITGLINVIMKSPDWKSTAIFLAWDD
jgi:phospholipase C